MNLFYYISDFMIPILIVYILVTGLVAKIPVYDEFVKVPPNRSNTTNRISINSVGPRNRGMMNNVMVCSGLWCVRFPSGLSCRIPGDRDCLADKCTKNFRNPAFRGEKKRGAPEAPRPNCLSGIRYLKNIDEISL